MELGTVLVGGRGEEVMLEKNISPSASHTSKNRGSRPETHSCSCWLMKFVKISPFVAEVMLPRLGQETEEGLQGMDRSELL